MCRHHQVLPNTPPGPYAIPGLSYRIRGEAGGYVGPHQPWEGLGSTCMHWNSCKAMRSIIHH